MRKIWVVLLALLSLLLLFLERVTIGDLDNQVTLTLHLLGLILFFLYIKSLYRKNLKFTISSSYQIFYFLGILVSSACVSNGAFMGEISEFGDSNGVFWVVFLYAMLAFESSSAGHNIGQYLRVSERYRVSALSKQVLLSLVIGTLLLAYAILIYFGGGPFFHGVNRVQYWGDVVPDELSFVRVLLLFTFFPALLLYYDAKRKEKKLSIYKMCIWSYYILAILLLGEKFSFFVIYFFTWTVVVAGYPEFRPSGRKLFLVSLVAIALLIAAVAIIYFYSGLGGMFIFNRIALQSQLLWKVLSEDGSVLITGIDWTCLFDCHNYGDAKDFIAQRYMPANLYEIAAESGTSLSGYLPSLYILLFGAPLSILLHLVASFFTGLIQFHVISSTEKRSFIPAFLFFVMYLCAIMIWYVGNTRLIYLILFSMFLLFFYKVVTHLKCGKAKGEGYV